MTLNYKLACWDLNLFRISMTLPLVKRHPFLRLKFTHNNKCSREIIYEKNKCGDNDFVQDIHVLTEVGMEPS